MAAVAAMMGLIGGRVIPFFTQRGLGRVEAVKPFKNHFLRLGRNTNAGIFHLD